jgi:dolichol kinase
VARLVPWRHDRVRLAPGAGLGQDGTVAHPADLEVQEPAGSELPPPAVPAAPQPAVAELPRPPEPDVPPPPALAAAPSATRDDLQLGRRLFHCLNGVSVATAYAVLFTHEHVVHLFGTVACLIYVVDRFRTAYPEVVERRMPWVNRLLVRAEERVRESAMIPYAIAVLLTILTVPKPAALVAIYTLAIADPLAAIVGIRWGRRKLLPSRSVEGTAMFFAATLAVAATVLVRSTAGPGLAIAGTALTVALAATVLELVPLRVDDNLTIPLVVGFATWVAAAAFGVALA